MIEDLRLNWILYQFMIMDGDKVYTNLQGLNVPKDNVKQVLWNMKILMKICENK